MPVPPVLSPAVFVRGPNGEDISYFVSKVVFTLHPSFAEATRGQSERRQHRYRNFSSPLDHGQSPAQSGFLESL